MTSGEHPADPRAVQLTDYARHWLTAARDTATYPGHPDATDAEAIAAAALVSLRHPAELLDIMTAIKDAGPDGLQLPGWWWTSGERPDPA